MSGAAAAHGAISDMGVGASMNAGAGLALGATVRHVYEIECLRPVTRLPRRIAKALGSERLLEIVDRIVPRRRVWQDRVENIVVNTGLDEYLDKTLKGSSYTAAWYVGLIDGSPTVAAGDTMSSHAGWAEVTAYDESVRQTLTLGTVSSQSVDNSASKASFTISTNSTTVGGAFITSDSTKSGTSGTLLGAGAFTGADKSTDDGDTLNVTATLTMAAA